MKKKVLLKNIIASVVRILAAVVAVVVLVLAIGTFGINFLMFHPVKGGYDEKTHGYVDIGTNQDKELL